MIEFAAADPINVDTSLSFLYGEKVGVSGDQYYGNFYMNAYVVRHRPGGWKQGDSLTANMVGQIVVLSDSNGVVPLTQAWIADQIGKFDIIIDYDNDGIFSYSLDGVCGFNVQRAPVWLAGPGTVAEGKSATVTAFRDPATQYAPLTVTLELGTVPGWSQATYGADFTLSAPTDGRFVTVYFPADKTSVEVAVAAGADGVREGIEGIRFAVYPGADYRGEYNYSLGRSPVADLTVTEPTASVWWVGGGVTIQEGSSASVSLVRSGGDTAAPLTVTAEISPGANLSPATYGPTGDMQFFLGGVPVDATNGKLTFTFAAGQTTLPLTATAFAGGDRNRSR